MAGEEKFESVRDEEIEAVTTLLRDVDMSTASAPHRPLGMSPDHHFFCLLLNYAATARKPLLPLTLSCPMNGKLLGRQTFPC